MGDFGMQRYRRGIGGHGARARLLAGAALAACAPFLAGGAFAQTPAEPTAPGPDGLPPRALYLEADTAGQTGTNGVVTATGLTERVLARVDGRTLRAHEVTYDLKTGIATAAGQAEMVDVDGTVLTASLLELDEEFRAGVAVDFAARLPDGGSMMAATAVRRSENVNELNYVLFTPCPICDAEGNRKTPSVSIQAEKVVQDESLRAILYRNAVFRVGGVPVFYLPWFAHPDPTVERASGLLVPIIDYDEGRGLSVETPYLFVISPSEDLVVSPQFNSRVAPLLNAQWRRRFRDGTVVARGGYTYERNFGDFDIDGDGDIDRNVEFGDREHRSYLLAHGRFDPDGPWRWGFTAERTSDKTLFDRYDIDNPYQDNGLYYGDERRLISQAYAERQTERSYVSVAAFAFQSLRVAQFGVDAFGNDYPALNVFEDDDTLPVVAPIVDARWEPRALVMGGRLRLRGSAVSLSRTAYVGAPLLAPRFIPPGSPANGAPGLPGVDSRRVTAQLDWRRTLLTSTGLRWEPFVDGRLDAYSVSDLPPMFGLEDETITRGRATAGVDLSYPLIRRLGPGSDLIIEPLAQLSASTDADSDPRIPNEDSQTLELDQASLFRVDRFPGHDLYEGGLRVTAGARATLRWDEVRSASLFIGRSMRDTDQTAFLSPVPDAPDRLYDPTGLASKTSDWVVQGEFSPTDRIRGWGHASVDSGGNVRRAEAAIDANWGRRNLASLSYIVDRSNPLFVPAAGPNTQPLNRNYEFVQVSAQQFVYGNWGVTVRGIADLDRDLITRSEVGVLFDDDCFRFEIGFRRDNTRVRPSGPSEGLFVRLNLATFGGTGYSQSDMR